jgi:beta-lactamase class D
MAQEDNSAYKFSYRVGTSIDEQHHLVEWLVGWIEENRHVYFMATLLKHKNAQAQSEVVNVTKKILEQNFPTL